MISFQKFSLKSNYACKIFQAWPIHIEILTSPCLIHTTLSFDYYYANEAIQNEILDDPLFSFPSNKSSVIPMR